MEYVSEAFASGRITQGEPVAFTRRVALLIPVLAVTACASDSGASSSAIAQAGAPSDLPSISNEAELIAQYDAVIALFPQLKATLTPLRDQHRAHLEALGAPGTSIPSALQGERAGSPQAARTQLADAEKRASQQRLSDCLVATNEAVARTLALISASEASHVAVLVDI